jgi:hypothetical protein
VEEKVRTAPAVPDLHERAAREPLRRMGFSSCW